MYAKKYDWKVFLPTADEWIVAYSLPPALHTIKLFMIGQAVELYLKSVVAKQMGSVDRALEQRHDIKKLWDLCKENDPNFMPEYEIRQSVLNAGKEPLGLFAPEGLELSSKLSKVDFEHYQANSELYAVTKMLPHL